MVYYLDNGTVMGCSAFELAQWFISYFNTGTPGELPGNPTESGCLDFEDSLYDYDDLECVLYSLLELADTDAELDQLQYLIDIHCSYEPGSND